MHRMVMIDVNPQTGWEIVMRRMTITDAMPERNPRLKIDPLFAPGDAWAMDCGWSAQQLLRGGFSVQSEDQLAVAAVVSVLTEINPLPRSQQ